ncbi:MAG: low-specificity L-threonine aldolase [Candidatus Promineifilaceae bacterium]|nr:low-specificity L-threonine aldolase [Candidatus Promineifilaceae bacterium]
MIDLRSDTVTKPTAEMMSAIAQAELGDDVWEDDPTVNRLQDLAAEKLGMEAALLVPSGTMGNLIAVLVHCPRGTELIVGDQAHIFRWEGGNVSMVGGIHPYTLPNQPDGTLAIADIQSAIRFEDVHLPRTSAIALENTHNNCGGVAIEPSYFAAVRQIADQHELKVHLDGARLFNAAAALNRSVQDFTQYADSVMVCLSKGLCAPVGSMLVGSGPFIAQARKVRKLLGGGMRQVGIIAAAGIVALEQMVDRLAEDHAHADRLAAGLNAVPGIQVQDKMFSGEVVTTNMVYFTLADDHPISPQELAGKLEAEYQILLDAGASRDFRLVTHYWVSTADIETTITGFQEILSCV